MTELTNLFVHMILAVSFVLIPFISRKDVVFGIKVPLSATDLPEVKQVRKQFILYTILAGITFMVIQLMNNNEKVLLITMFTSLIVYFSVYVMAYKNMKKVKAESDWIAVNKTIVDTQFRSRRIIISPVWYLGYLMIFLVSVGLVIFKFDSLPDMLRMQVNAAGEVTQMMAKDKAILFLLAAQVMTMLVLVCVQVIIKKAKQELSSENVHESIERNVAFRYAVSFMLYLLGLSVGIVFFITLMFTMEMIEDYNVVVGSVLILTFLPVIGLFIYGVKYRQDGTNYNASESEVIQKDDDRYWKLGMFYFNSKDPAVFISKRVGIGWSVNHARWQAWALYLSIVVLIVLAAIFGG